MEICHGFQGEHIFPDENHFFCMNMVNRKLDVVVTKLHSVCRKLLMVGRKEKHG